ncbi:MAG: phosphotransferase [Actinophytocola sp.]|nr:phosphotransferase [Actinophytocola sp.]
MHVDTSAHDDERVDGESHDNALAAAVAAAELALANRFGSAITLSKPEDLAGSGPAVVVRATVASSPFSLPRTLVIKHYPDPDDEASDPFAAEAVSYQLFTALTSEDRMCPELLGHDVTHRVLVQSDLGSAPTLADKLRIGDARVAEGTLLSWSRALGRMHATTAHREADFNALLRRFGGQPPSEDTEAADAAEQLPGVLADVLGVATSAAVIEQVAVASQRLNEGECRAFSPVDLAPENNLVTSDGVRFLDFEHGRVRNAMIDVAHLRVPFAFWRSALALPAGMSEAMIAAWRAEVTGIWPQLADDDEFTGALLDSHIACVWTQTARELPDLGESPDTSQTSRPAALESWWRELATRAGQLHAEEIAEHAAAVADAIERRFGPGLELPLYPAFR